MKSISITNEFHGRATTERHVRRALCPSPDTCRCLSSSASGNDTLVITQAEPIYSGSCIIAYRLPAEVVNA